MVETILVVGATGFAGDGIARHLAADGRRITGVIRSEEAVRRLRAAGLAAVVGDVEHDIEAMIGAARTHDAIIYDAQVAAFVEQQVVSAMLDTLTGSNNTFVLLSGSGVLCQCTEGAWNADGFAEEDKFMPEPFATARVGTEALVRGAAARGLRAMVVQPPLIWGR